MMATDVLAVVMVQAEAANRGWLAGIMDTLGWLVSITTTTVSVSVFAGHHSLGEKFWVVGLVSAANLFGTKSGQMLGQRLMRAGKMSIEDRVHELEQVVLHGHPTH